ncbi:MAG: Tetratricopeptide domain protein [Phycisphaerales bacterium]|jgi:lipoprotein NlpI|nr:Tetratricopeptide domain protein [Phycisphaerales bacterium]
MIVPRLFVAALLFAATSSLAGAAEAPTASVPKALAEAEKDSEVTRATKMIDADPKDPHVYLNRASVYDTRREFAKSVADFTKAIELAPSLNVAYQRRGEDLFRLGKFKESVADFDKLIELRPDQGPYLWQRGIALYYAGEFEKGAKQFELHKTVNPDDVENAAWHYLCVARAAGVEKARQSLIPTHGDTRVPMSEIHALFAGKATAQDVMKAAAAGDPVPSELKPRLFYAHLYVGLYEEAAGHTDAAKEHILLAAEKYADDDYMGDVARAHAAVLKNGPADK